MKEGLRKLKGTTINTDIGQLTLSQTFREDDCEFDQLYYTTEQEAVIAKIYDLEKEESIDRFHHEEQMYTKHHYDELADPLFIKEVQIKKVNYGLMAIKIQKHSTLRHISENMTYSEWLTLSQMIIGFVDKLRTDNQIFLNIHPSSISRNAFGEFKLTDPEFMCKQGNFQDLSVTNEMLIDLCEKQYRYRAPELLDQYSKGRIDYKSDLFSFGTVLYEMLYHQYPFESKLAQINCNFKTFPDKSFFTEFITKLLQPYNKRESLQNLRGMVEAERKKVPKQLNVKAMSSGSTAQSKGSNIFSGITQIFSKLTTETESWYLNFTENDDNRPEQKYLNLIINKLYKKEAKLQKLQFVMMKYLQEGELPLQQNQILKTSLLIFQLLRRGPNVVNHQWQDTLQLIQKKSASNPIIIELCQFCRQKIGLHQKYKNLFRGNFFMEDLSKFKMITIEVLEGLQGYLNWMLQSIQNKFLFIKKERASLQYARELYCDEILDLISMLIFSVLCVRKDNELNLRKDSIDKLKDIEKKLNHQLKKISYLSNHVNAHAIYSMEGEFFYYQEEIQLRESPYYTSLQHFYKNCREYKGLCVPQNFALTYCSGDQKQFLSNENNRAEKTQTFKEKEYFVNDDEEVNNNSFKAIETFSPQKSKLKEQFLEMLKGDKPKKQSKQVIQQNIFNLKVVKSKQEQVKKTVKFDDFFKLDSKPTGPQTKSHIQFANFDKKTLEPPQKKQVHKKSEDFSFFEGLVQVQKPKKQPEIQKKESKGQMSFDNFFENFGHIKQKQKGKQKPALTGSSSQKLILQNLLNVGIHKGNSLIPLSPVKTKPKSNIDPALLAEILSGLRLKQLKQVIMQNQSIIIQFNKLKLQKIIGSGSAGQVYFGKYQNEALAIKKVKTKQNPNALKEFQRELLTYIKIKRNPYLVSLVGLSKSVQDFYLLTEFCNSGSLFDLLHKKANTVALSWSQKITLALQIAKGMLALHEMKPPIIHRDLKSLNVFVIQNKGTFTAKVADFGLSRSPESQMMTMYLGTLHWMAPQLLDNKQYSIKVDIYSFAVVLWEICSRKTPYNELSNPMAIIKHVTIEHKRPNLGSVPPDCPPDLIELMKCCWAYDPNQRPSFSQIIEKLSKINVIF